MFEARHEFRKNIVTQTRIDSGIDLSNAENTAVLYGVSQKELVEILGVSLQSIKKLNVAKNRPLNKNLSEQMANRQFKKYLDILFVD